MNPSQIGWLFVQQYYTFLNESPERLYLFYNTNSIFTHGKEGENVINVVGQQVTPKFIKKAINHEIRSKQFQNCQVFVSNVDSQASASGGVVVQVLGELSNNNDACHKFCQTFFLAEQPEGYYVLNDIFRFLKEELELSDGEKTLGDRSTPPVFNFQEPKPTGITATANGIASTTSAKKEKIAIPVQEKPKPVIQKSPQNGAPPPQSVTPKADPPKASSQAQKPKTPQPVKQAHQTQATAKPTTAPAAATLNGAPPSPATAVTNVSNPATSVEKKTPVAAEKRATSPVKKAAPASWSKVVASADPPPAQAVSQSAPTSAKPVLVKATAKEKKPATPQSQGQGQGQAKKPEENTDGFQDVPTRHRNLDRNKSNEGNLDFYLEKDKATIYIRNVADNMDRKILQDSFEKFGQVQHVDLPSGKHIAFVTFKNVESAQAAIGKTIAINGVELLAEERKKNFAQKQNGSGVSYRGTGTGFQSRGRGGNRPPMAQRGRGSEQK